MWARIHPDRNTWAASGPAGWLQEAVVPRPLWQELPGCSGAPVSVDAGPQFPETSPWVLRWLRASVSVDSAPTSFLRLTTGPDKAGVFCLHGSIPIFPKVYTGGSEDVSVVVWAWPHVLP